MQRVKSISKKKTKANKTPIIRKSLKGAIMGLLFTILSVLIFAVIVKQFGLGDRVISVVNQALKVVSIFIAAFLASRNAQDAKVMAGIVAGVLFVIFGYLIFSLIDSQWGRVSVLLADLVMGAVIGMLTAMIFTKLFSSDKKQNNKQIKRV